MKIIYSQNFIITTLRIDGIRFLINRKFRNVNRKHYNIIFEFTQHRCSYIPIYTNTRITR